MTWFFFALFAIGILLSAFFSGSETGLYRVSRMRLVLDGLDGDSMARGLLWLTNNPALFVATTLIGNNLANYLTSLAIVLLAAEWFVDYANVVELIAPVVLAPLVFVYGELLPKYLFYHAPNRLLRWVGPLFFLFTFLFAVASAVLWLLGRALESFVGESPGQTQLRLARQELQEVLAEGQHVGLIKPAQTRLVKSLFSYAGQPVSSHMVPLSRITKVREGTPKSEILRLARRHKVSVIPLQTNAGELTGYVRVVDLCLSDSEVVTPRPLVEIGAKEKHGSAVMRMQSTDAALARVVGDAGQTLGLLYRSDLLQPLFHHA